jgi:uncharacterized protein (DUF58 family)
MSGSQEYGTGQKLKRDIAAELCAVLAFSALKNNDKVGMIIFTDQIELSIPPKKGRMHTLRLIRELIAFRPAGRGTNIKGALEYANHVMKKRSIMFLVSDFMDAGFEQALKISGRKHDLIAVHLHDPKETELPDVGLMKLADAETGRERWIDTSLAGVREAYRRAWLERKQQRDRLFLTSNVDSIGIDVHGSYVQPLVAFFRMRERRQ